MKILHLNGFTRSELDGYRTIVVRNVLESIRNLIHAIDRFAIPYEREETRASAQGVLAVAEDLRVPVMTPALAEMISAVWTDGAALKAMKEHGSEFYMMDTAP